MKPLVTPRHLANDLSGLLRWFRKALRSGEYRVTTSDPYFMALENQEVGKTLRALQREFDKWISEGGKPIKTDLAELI